MSNQYFRLANDPLKRPPTTKEVAEIRLPGNQIWLRENFKPHLRCPVCCKKHKQIEKIEFCAIQLKRAQDLINSLS